MATSPLPDWKFFRESLALLSITVTLVKMPVSSFWASLELFAAYPVTLPRMAAPYAATMFHFAPPLWEGSGVRIWTPLLVRSLQSAMRLGFPERTSNTTGVVATIAPSGSLVQSWVISPAFCTIFTSGASESATTSAGNPLATFWAWVVLPPNEDWKITDCPSWAVFH